MNMKAFLFPISAAAALLFGSAAIAQTFTSEPVGFRMANLLGGSDTHLSVPLVRPAVSVASIQSVSGSTITVSRHIWTASEFVYAAGTQPNHYYALIGASGAGGGATRVARVAANPKEGHAYPIIGNGTNTLTVDLGPDTLAGIPAGAQVSVIPNWTLSTLFPASDQNVSFTPTTSTGQYKTQIRVPDVSAAGTNLPYITYFFSNNVDGTSNNVGWRRVGDNTTDRGDDPLLPDSHFVVRNLNGAPTLPLVSRGAVLLKKFATPLVTSATTAQDNPAALLRPLDVALNATGLKTSDGSFRIGDQLLLFNNAQVGYDKSPSATYIQTAATIGPWRLLGDNVNDRGNDVIPAGAGFVIRKAAGNGQPDFWTNSAPVRALSAVSRKIHGDAGTFDLFLPLAGTPAVECRYTGGDYQVVFTFPSAVTFTGAAVTSGSVASLSAYSTASNVVTINLAGVADAQWITITLLDVNDGANTNNVAVRMGLLNGDTNGNGAVNSSDVGLTKSESGQPLTLTNFRNDVNANGLINSTDLSIVKWRSGASLPLQEESEDETAQAAAGSPSF
jgi:uncharacterized protein (TIGR02597 family)